MSSERSCKGSLRTVQPHYWCRRGESNPRPRDYETLALPLSYAGTGPSCYGYRQGGVKPSAVTCRCSKIMSPLNCNETLSHWEGGDNEADGVARGESD